MNNVSNNIINNNNIINSNIEFVESVSSENITNLLRFIDYFNKLSKQEKIFISKKIFSGNISNINLYSSLLNAENYNEYISELLYRNSIFTLFNRGKFGRRFNLNPIGKSKLNICTLAKELLPIPIGNINDIEKNSSKSPSLSISSSLTSLSSDSSDDEIIYLDYDNNLNCNEFEFSTVFMDDKCEESEQSD